jgi:hypothetical protein
VEVLVLLLEGQDQSLETCIQFAIVHQSVFADYPVDEFSVLGVVLWVVSLTQVVHPIILRIVLDVGMNSIDLLDY